MNVFSLPAKQYGTPVDLCTDVRYAKCTPSKYMTQLSCSLLTSFTKDHCSVCVCGGGGGEQLCLGKMSGMCGCGGGGGGTIMPRGGHSFLGTSVRGDSRAWA